MMSRLPVINMNLALVLMAGLLAAGCTSKDDEKLATVRLHLEVNKEMNRRSQEISVLRSHPVLINVEDAPFLHEGYIEEIELIESNGGHEIRLKFNQSGTWMLENITAGNYGKRIAVMAQFPETRWVSATVIRGRVSNGIYQFAPDADLEETRRIVDGMNLTLEKRKRQNWID